VSRRYSYRRKLPHKQWEGKVYFITFSTHHREVLTPGSRDIVLTLVCEANGKLFDLHATVVRPDHVHLLLTPRTDANGTVGIPGLCTHQKYFGARHHKYLGRKGRVWQEESFDWAMREVENTRGRIEYIQGNPVRAGLVRAPHVYRWLWTESDASDEKASA
jgi:REP element-mobilizing transposase RayT